MGLKSYLSSEQPHEVCLRPDTLQQLSLEYDDKINNSSVEIDRNEPVNNLLEDHLNQNQIASK